MKKIILSIVFAFPVLIVNGQTTIQYGNKVFGVQKEGLYKTYDDLLNDKIEIHEKPDDGVVVNDYVKLGDKFIPFKQVKYYGYKDSYGNRFRISGPKAFNLLSPGKICLYSYEYKLDLMDKKTKQIKRAGYGATYGYGTTNIYYSNGPEGEIIEIKKWQNKEKVAEVLFKDDLAIKNEYLNDNSDDYDPDCKKCNSDEIERTIFYVNKYNAVHK